jgi:predicted nucleic acid-binding protein
VSGVVADASPLIAFAQIGQLPLLQVLFTTLLVPPAVGREIAPSVPSQPWIAERQPTQPLAPHVLQAGLGAGESEAISLALELRADRLIVDEKAARHLAEALGLNVIGTLGVLLAAKRKGLIPAVRPLVEALLANSFWISPQLVERALSGIGEGRPS